MSDTTDAARRERAEKWVTWYLNDERNVEEPDEQLVLAYLAGAREEAARVMDQPHTSSCGHTWTMRHTACPECFAALKDEIAALRECIGLLSTLTHDVDCGLPIAELGPAIYREVSTEIAALREQIKALKGLISGVIQHSWTSEDYDKFWLAVGKEKP